MMKPLNLFPLLVGLGMLGCQEHSSEPVEFAPSLGVYQLLDSTITAMEAWGLPLDSLVLKSVPMFSESDFTSYSWNTHLFTVRPGIDSVLYQMRMLPYKSFGLPFVVVVDSQRIYLGSFWWLYSSLTPKGPYIALSDTSPYRIALSNYATVTDHRSDPRIFEALNAANILAE